MLKIWVFGKKIVRNPLFHDLMKTLVCYGSLCIFYRLNVLVEAYKKLVLIGTFKFFV